MIKRQHVVRSFFDEAEVMRDAIDERLRDAYRQQAHWYFFCDPLKYAYLRTEPQNLIPEPVFRRFLARLRSWCAENLGLVPADWPSLHLMVNGCRLGLHSDFHNGVWGYVFSLTRWETRRFSGGETLLMRDGVPSYKKHHVHGEVLYELIPPNFNQLLVFDDRIVHATPTIEGSMDPLEGRIALVGHIRATSPMIKGPLPVAAARSIILGGLEQLRQEIEAYKEVQGTISFSLMIGGGGAVEAVSTLTDNLVTATMGYGRSDAVNTVRSIVQRMITALRFPSCEGRSTVVVAVLIPIPDLRPLHFAVAHDKPTDVMRERVAGHLRHFSELQFQGGWIGELFDIQEPLPGTIRVEPGRVVFSFDAPMWVPSQRERFQVLLTDWVSNTQSGE